MFHKSINPNPNPNPKKLETNKNIISRNYKEDSKLSDL